MVEETPPIITEDLDPPSICVGKDVSKEIINIINTRRISVLTLAWKSVCSRRNEFKEIIHKRENNWKTLVSTFGTSKTPAKDKLELWAEVVLEVERQNDKNADTKNHTPDVLLENKDNKGYHHIDIGFLRYLFSHDAFLGAGYVSAASTALGLSNGIRFGDGEAVAAVIMDAQCDTDNNGDVTDKELDANSERINSSLEANANFMMSVTVVSALLVAVQLQLIVMEATPYSFALEKHIFRNLFKSQIKWIGTISDQEGLYALILQPLSTITMFPNLVRNLLTILETTKGYGHLMYWCAELETQVWYSRSSNIQKTQDGINRLGSEFCGSLYMYILFTRGPIVVLFFYFFVKYLEFKYSVYNINGFMSIQIHQAKRILRSKKKDV